MRLERNDEGTVVVVLSRRNLQSLLAKLDGFPPNSACTLTYTTKDTQLLVVQAEADEVHYMNPERDSIQPGKMHPETEERIK